MDQVHIDHFSDILCVWAYVAQIRMSELEAEFGDKVTVDYHLYPVFGDVPGKMEKSWSSRGGVSAYSEHVQQVANKFDHVDVKPDAWGKVTPQSSLPAHVYVAAVKLAEGEQRVEQGASLKFTVALREAFFENAKDISSKATLNEIAEENGLAGPIQQYLDNGTAFSLVCRDMHKASELGVNSSPTLIFNEGRQKLAGNVGYRIIEANIKELLENAVGQLSWC